MERPEQPATPTWRSWFRPAIQAWCALAASVLWILGLGSVVGVVLGVGVLRNLGASQRDRRLAVAAIVAGAIGEIVASFILLQGASGSVGLVVKTTPTNV